MKTRSLAVCIVMAVIAVLMLTGSSSATAQLCAVIKVVNETNCALGPCFYDANGNRTCLILGPNGTASSIGFINGFNPIGAISAAKNGYPFAGLQGCTPCIMIPGATTTIGCCAIVCFDRPNCTITIRSCPAPCLP